MAHIICDDGWSVRVLNVGDLLRRQHALPGHQRAGPRDLMRPLAAALIPDVADLDPGQQARKRMIHLHLLAPNSVPSMRPTRNAYPVATRLFEALASNFDPLDRRSCCSGIERHQHSVIDQKLQHAS